jgi:hypothetical protein
VEAASSRFFQRQDAAATLSHLAETMIKARFSF